jgi:hypothetical protein
MRTEIREPLAQPHRDILLVGDAHGEEDAFRLRLGG